MSINDKPTTELESNGDEVIQVDELTVLKQRATVMGINFSNNIGLEALRKKVNAAQEGNREEEEPMVEDKDPEVVNPLSGLTASEEVEEDLNPFQKARREQLKLVRLRITNLDPKKKDLPGEFITVANDFMGTVRKYVPFGEFTNSGYHVPYCIYNFLKSRKFLQITERVGKNGVPEIRQKYVPEFSLEILPMMTEEERRNLATAQLSTNSLADE